MLTAVALAFLQRNPAVSSVLVGTKSLDYVRANIAALAELVDDALIDEVVRVTEKRR